MNEKTGARKEWMQCILGAVAAVGICAVLFSTFTDSAVAAGLGKTEKIPTQYPAGAAAVQTELPKGYKKASYKVVSDPLLPTDSPAGALTQAEAAELGAQMLFELYGVSLEGATVYMGYSPESDSLPRANWSGDVRWGAERKPEIPAYSFMMDAVTGERFTTAWSRWLDGEVSLAFDPVLHKNPGDYLTLAKETASKLNLVHGAVESASYNGQGYTCNDPSVSLEVVGVNGETAFISFSRHDKALKGISYDTYYTLTTAAAKRFQEKAEAQMAEEQAKSKGKGGSGGLQSFTVE